MEKKDAKSLSDFNDEELLAIIDGRRPDRDHAEDALGGERTITPWWASVAESCRSSEYLL